MGRTSGEEWCIGAGAGCRRCLCLARALWARPGPAPARGVRYVGRKRGEGGSCASSRRSLSVALWLCGPPPRHGCQRRWAVWPSVWAALLTDLSDKTLLLRFYFRAQTKRRTLLVPSLFVFVSVKLDPRVKPGCARVLQAGLVSIKIT